MLRTTQIMRLWNLPVETAGKLMEGWLRATGILMPPTLQPIPVRRERQEGFAALDARADELSR